MTTETQSCRAGAWNEAAAEYMLLRLADAYADASFEQGLNQRTEDPAPEAAREELVAEVRRLAAAPAVSAPAWQPIETAPKDGRKLILFYLNRNGKARTVMARWVTDEEAAETDADGVGLEGGWYECIDNWGEYSQVTITEGEPSRWMALPANPGFLAPATGDAP